MMGVKAKGSEISQNPKEEQSQETKIPAPQSLGSEHTSEKSPDIVKGFSAPPETPTFTRAHLSHLLIWTPKPWSSVQDPKLWVLVVFPNLGANLRTCFVRAKPTGLDAVPGGPAFCDLPWRPNMPDPCSGDPALIPALYGSWGWQGECHCHIARGQHLLDCHIHFPNGRVR